ncbi:MAG: hypothetical protein IH886_00910 [Nitrospinae bacterium]|nr:hypothetical protein [Nitrospinota bacterium]
MSKQPEIHILKIPDGKPNPLFIKASHVERVILGGGSPGHLANLRSKGAGPKYFILNGSIYYKPEDLESYYGQNPVETTNQPLPVKQFEPNGASEDPGILTMKGNRNADRNETARTSQAKEAGPKN